MKSFSKRTFLLIIIAFLFLLPGLLSASQTIAVVVHQDFEIAQLDREQVKAIFLSEANAPYKNITVFDRTDFALKGAFYRHVAGMSMNRLRAFWAKKVFTGRGRPPKTVALPDHMELMQRDKNVMTYVFSDKVPEGFKVVYQFETEE